MRIICVRIVAESLYIPLSQNIEKYKNDVDLLLSVILGI